MKVTVFVHLLLETTPEIAAALKWLQSSLLESWPEVVKHWVISAPSRLRTLITSVDNTHLSKYLEEWKVLQQPAGHTLVSSDSWLFSLHWRTVLSG